MMARCAGRARTHAYRNPDSYHRRHRRVALLDGEAMNHKRKRPKNRRAGCLMCKPHKANGVTKLTHIRGIKGKIKLVEAYIGQGDAE